MTDRDAMLARLAAFNRLITARDMAILDEVWSDQGFVLLGSEAGERAASREELTALFHALFAKPYRLSFSWRDPEVIIQGDIAWVTAEGMMTVIHPDREQPMPYRMVSIFHKQGATWAWRLFSGSEPAQPPPA